MVLTSLESPCKSSLKRFCEEKTEHMLKKPSLYKVEPLSCVWRVISLPSWSLQCPLQVSTVCVCGGGNRVMVTGALERQLLWVPDLLFIFPPTCFLLQQYPKFLCRNCENKVIACGACGNLKGGRAEMSWSGRRKHFPALTFFFLILMS